jgi:chemotaxis protein methyltransferase CheR
MAFTYYFRDKQTLDMIRDYVIPALRTRRYIHIWDAGSAMGPEPYSLAIVLRENMGQMIFRNVKIHASDIDTSDQFAEIIGQGVYQQEHLRSVPKEILERYFEPNEKPGHYTISSEMRNCVSFQRHDLLTLQPIRTNLSLVVCKNVLLHLTSQERVQVIAMFYDALDEDGFFVTEQTQKLPKESSHLFEPVISNAQVYRKVGSNK